MYYRQSMIFYRGKDIGKWEDELDAIIDLAKQRDKQRTTNFWGCLQVLMSPDFLRPFRCIGILQMLYNMAGFLIISSYTDTFLEV